MRQDGRQGVGIEPWWKYRTDSGGSLHTRPIAGQFVQLPNGSKALRSKDRQDKTERDETDGGVGAAVEKRRRASNGRSGFWVQGIPSLASVPWATRVKGQPRTVPLPLDHTRNRVICTHRAPRLRGRSTTKRPLCVPGLTCSSHSSPFLRCILLPSQMQLGQTCVKRPPLVSSLPDAHAPKVHRVAVRCFRHGREGKERTDFSFSCRWKLDWAGERPATERLPATVFPAQGGTLSFAHPLCLAVQSNEALVCERDGRESLGGRRSCGLS